MSLRTKHVNHVACEEEVIVNAIGILSKSFPERSVYANPDACKTAFSATNGCFAEH
jgi:hypothetical protein